MKKIEKMKKIKNSLSIDYREEIIRHLIKMMKVKK